MYKIITSDATGKQIFLLFTSCERNRTGHNDEWRIKREKIEMQREEKNEKKHIDVGWNQSVSLDGYYQWNHCRAYIYLRVISSKYVISVTYCIRRRSKLINMMRTPPSPAVMLKSQVVHVVEILMNTVNPFRGKLWKSFCFTETSAVCVVFRLYRFEALWIIKVLSLE